MVEFDEVYTTKKTIRDGIASNDISYKNLCLEIIKDSIQLQRFNYSLYSVEVYNLKQTIRDALASDDISYKNNCLEVIKIIYSTLHPSSQETSLVSDEDPVSSSD